MSNPSRCSRMLPQGMLLVSIAALGLAGCPSRPAAPPTARRVGPPPPDRPAAERPLPTVPRVLAFTRPAPPPATGKALPLLAHLRTELGRNLAGLRRQTRHSI